MRSFYILNARASSSPPVSGATTPLLIQPEARSPPKSLVRERLRYRDMVWAFHSESQEILLAASTAACGNKMKWNDAKALGLFLWLSATESLVCSPLRSLLPISIEQECVRFYRRPRWRQLPETNT